MTAKFQPVVLCTAMIIGALALLSHSNTASAMTLRFNPLEVAPQTADAEQPIQKVGHRRGGRRAYRGGGGRRAYRGGGRRYGYNRGRHGPRYRYRRGNNRRYYNGYWYGVPFWLGAAAVAGPYYADPAPRYSGGSCGYWARQCRANWNTRSDFNGCMRYQGCQ